MLMRVIQNTAQRMSRLLRAEYGYYCKRFVLSDLIFAVTYKCNFRCQTCYYGYNMDNAIANNDRELNIDEIKKISLSIGNLDKLLISGGEPFLRDDLVDICEIFYLQNKVGFIQLPTNGFYTEKIYEYTRKILYKCPKAQIEMGVALDGLEETHDEIKGVKGSFKKVIETVRQLANLKKEFNNFKIYIFTVVNNLNLNEIGELVEFIKNNLPIDGYGPSPLRGIPYNKALFPPSYKEWAELSKTFIKYHSCWRKRPINTRLESFLVNSWLCYLYRLTTDILKGENLPFRCQAGNIIGVLEPNGDVRLCELTNVVGNVRSVNYDFKAIWFSDKANQERKKMKNCACTHACFLWPSASLRWPVIMLKSHLWNKLMRLIQRHEKNNFV